MLGSEFPTVTPLAVGWDARWALTRCLSHGRLINGKDNHMRR